MKNNKFLTILMILFLCISCAQESENDKEVTEFDEVSFFSIVYETLAVRQIGQTDWTLTTGDRDVKFDTSTTIDENETLPDQVEGTFQFALTEYTRSQAIAACTGGWDGNFTLDLFEEGGSTGYVEDLGDVPYNVLDPYIGDDTEEVIDPDAVVEGIRTYFFSMNVNNVSLFPQESCSFPFTNYSLKIVRFPNGTLILEDSSKGLEYFMRPKLRTER